MTEYVVLIPANEDDWDTASPEDREAMYAKHREFSDLLAERGHKITGGHELTSPTQPTSSAARATRSPSPKARTQRAWSS